MPPLRAAYRQLEEDVKRALKEHRGNHSVMSIGLNVLLMYPDRPYEVGELWGWEFNEETGRREKFLIGRADDLDRECLQAKERRLLEIIQAEIRAGRRCHVYAVYTQKRDVTRRLESILTREGRVGAEQRSATRSIDARRCLSRRVSPSGSQRDGTAPPVLNIHLWGN